MSIIDRLRQRSPEAGTPEDIIVEITPADLVALKAMLGADIIRSNFLRVKQLDGEGE